MRRCLEGFAAPGLAGGRLLRLLRMLRVRGDVGRVVARLWPLAPLVLKARRGAGRLVPAPRALSRLLTRVLLWVLVRVLGLVLALALALAPAALPEPWASLAPAPVPGPGPVPTGAATPAWPRSGPIAHPPLAASQAAPPERLGRA